MELNAFLNSPVTRQAVASLAREVQPADLGFTGAALLPEVVMDATEYKRTIIVLGQALIANDVAPLSEGVMKGRLRRASIGGGLIDSASKLHLDGEEVEMLRALIGEIRGDVVRASMPELNTYLQLNRVHLVEPLLMNRERKRWTLMGTGRAYLDGARDDDFTKPPVLSVYADDQVEVIPFADPDNIYGGVDANYFALVRRKVEQARSAGQTIVSQRMNSQTLGTILGRDDVRRELGLTSTMVTPDGKIAVNMTQGAASLDALNAKLVSLQLPPITVEDNYWADQVREQGDPEGPVGTIVTKKYVPDGRIIFVPRASALDLNAVNPTVPFRVATFDANAAVGLHVIGRLTGHSIPGVLVFGPEFNDRNMNPNLHGNAGMAHMPFLNVPAGFFVVEYATSA